MKKIALLSIIALLMFSSSKAQTVTSSTQWGNYTSAYHSFSYNFDSEGYFNWSITVYPGGFDTGNTNWIGIDFAEDGPTYNLDLSFSEETFYDNPSGTVTKSGSWYVGTVSRNYLLNMSFGDSGNNHGEGLQDYIYVDYDN